MGVVKGVTRPTHLQSAASHKESLDVTGMKSSEVCCVRGRGSMSMGRGSISSVMKKDEVHGSCLQQ